MTSGVNQNRSEPAGSCIHQLWCWTGRPGSEGIQLASRRVRVLWRRLHGPLQQRVDDMRFEFCWRFSLPAAALPDAHRPVRHFVFPPHRRINCSWISSCYSVWSFTNVWCCRGTFCYTVWSFCYVCPFSHR